ncbi:hypothetical protein N7450_000149 [Penicillium hetheringtonii]|uniref:Nephrocystin 3-like N-terminal domain-containing protein n=1 Tax=Penicillium hetheringtonii TaxID=911720 RepID=A0AAD6E1Q3_9EURO|nr:hypothetical protein N7450_000149 [Penicillium hetheringtonii]
MAPGIISPVPGDINSTLYTIMPGKSRQTSGMSVRYESDNFSSSGFSQRRESGIIRKLYSTNADINSLVQQFHSNGGIQYGNSLFPAMTDAPSIRDWISNERMNFMPPEGSSSDKVLSWAQLFVGRLNEFDEAIRDDSGAAATVSYICVGELLRLWKENETNAEALMTSFGFFYSLSANLSNLLGRAELFDVSTDIRRQLVSALLALVELVSRVTKTFREKILQGTEIVTIDLYEFCSQQVTSFSEACKYVAEAMWEHQLSRETLASFSRSDISEIRSWLAPKDHILSRLAENTSHFAYEREEMTCRWVGPFLSEFLQSPQTTLSITGKPGSGKTILASVIVDSVSDQNSGYMALFVPINARIPAATHPTSIAKTILFQLFEKRIGNVRLLEILNRAHKACYSITDFGKYENILWSAVEDALAAPLPNAKELVIVVDGLDEASCSEDSLLKRLSGVVKTAYNVKLVTLGTEEYSEADSGKVKSLSVDANRVFEDISVVVRKVLSGPRSSSSKIFNTIPELGQEILIDQITEASQGSFLWAKLATKLACHETTADGMQRKIEALVQQKPSVTEFVTHSLSGSDVSEDTKYMLLWLATTERPLVINELSALASVKLDTQTLSDHTSISPREILAPVKSLVVIDNGQVYLRHGLIRNAILDIASKGRLVHIKDRHHDLVTRLLVYIKNTVTEEQEMSLHPLSSHVSGTLRSKNPLLEFAVRYWPFYLRQSDVYTSGGQPGDLKDFAKFLPSSITFLLLQASLWENQDTPKRCQLQTTVTDLIRQTYSSNSPIVLQSVLNLVKLYNDIGQTSRATSLVYELTEFPDNLLDDRKLVTKDLAILMDISTRREKMFKLLISCYKIHYGVTSDLVIKTYYSLISHYHSTREQSKIDEIKLEIQKITGYYDHNGTHDELKVVLRPGEQPTEDIQFEFTLEIWQDQTTNDTSGELEVQTLLQKAEQYVLDGSFTKAEHIYVHLWQNACSKCLTEYSEYWEQVKLEAAVVYSQFLLRQDRKIESSAILNSIWEEYRFSNLFVSNSTVSLFQQLADLMVTVDLFTAANSIFKQILRCYKSAKHSESTISDIEKSIHSTHQSIIQHASSSSSTVSETTLIEIISGHSQTSIQESTLNALFKRVDLYTTEHRWNDATRIVKEILGRLWPSLFSSSINDVTLPKEFTDTCVTLAGILGNCYQYRCRFTEEENIRIRIYRAVRSARPVDDQTRVKVTTSIIKLYKRSRLLDRVLAIQQEKLNDYDGFYSQDSPEVVNLLRELARLSHPRPIFVDYYIRIIEVLNKGHSHCNPKAIDDLVIVVDELWRQGRYSDLRHWYSLLFSTFLEDPEQHPYLKNPEYVHTIFIRYTECLRKFQISYDSIVQISKQYYEKVKSFFGRTESITIKATLNLAVVYQETKVNKHLAFDLYQDLLEIKSSEIDHDDIRATIDGLREEDELNGLHSSLTSSEKIGQRKATLISRLEKFVENHSWSSHETLSTLEEIVSFCSKHKETSITLHEELHSSAFQVLSTKLSSTQLVSAATTIANGYLATGEISEAHALSNEIYRQLVMRATASSTTHKLELAHGRQSLIFLAQLEHTLNVNRASTIVETLASLTAEYLYFEEFRALTLSSSSSSSFFSVAQAASNLYALLIQNKRDKSIAESVYDDYVAFFRATKGQRIQFTDTAEIQTLLRTIIGYLSKHESDNFLRSVGVASYYGIQEYLRESQYESAANLALGAFHYLSAGNDELSRQEGVKYILVSGLLIAGHTSIVDAIAKKQLADASAQILPEAVRVLRELDVDISHIGLENLNLLIGVLGRQKQYELLLWVLSGLWKNRSKLAVWGAGVTLQLARHYILARYLTEDGWKAARLAEDILYNCRRVNGPSHPSTLEMSILVSQLYTGVAEKLQSSTNGKHMAERIYKKIAGVHEYLLRVFLDPNIVDMDGSLESSLDGSHHGLDLNDPTVNINGAEKDHIQSHLQLMKLAIQRLGDWPQDHREYLKLDEELFTKFRSELDGVQHVDSWDLRSFGSGKASASDDLLDLENCFVGADNPNPR